MIIRILVILLLLGISIPAHAIDDAEQALNEWRPDLALDQLDARPMEDDANWQRLRGAALIFLGSTEEGIEHLERALEMAPDDARSHWSMLPGLMARMNDTGAFGQLRLARQLRRSMEAAVDLDPDNPEYRYGLMQYYIGAPGVAGGSQRKAEEQRDKLASIDPLWGAAADALLLFDDGDNEAGLEKLLTAWDGGNGVQEVGMSIVFNAQNLERWDTARSTAEQVLARKPGHPNALYQLGRTAALSGEHLDTALEALEHYTALPFINPSHPSRAAAYWRKGQIHQHQGMPEEARKAWHTALELDPDFDDARESLSALDELNGEGQS